MAKVRIIPAQIKQGNRNRQVEEAETKLKVAAYCRVSTLYEDQASSYETQVAHYKEFITKNPKWELAGIYADDGISGTDTKKRNQFNQMIMMPSKVKLTSSSPSPSAGLPGTPSTACNISGN